MPEPPGSTDAERGVLVGVDLRGIQGFVYEGRRLLDAVGRSALVGDLVRTDHEENKPGIADLFGDAEYEVLRDTGGALWVAFTGERAAPDATEFTARYTRRLRQTSVRIQPVVVHLPYGAGGDGPRDLTAAVRALSPRLAAERGDSGHTPVLGYGVTAICDVTGRPAEAVDARRGRETPEAAGQVTAERVAWDVLHARDRGRTWHEEKSREWLKGLPPFDERLPLDMPMDVEQLGRAHEDVSRQAVIHLDFNDLGTTLQTYAGATHGTPRYVERMRDLSGQVRELTEGLARAMTRAVADALARAMTRAVADALEPEPDGRDGLKPVLRGSLPDQLLRAAIHETEAKKKFVKVPLRPIVAGGDDLTVVCDGRLAWSLTRFVLDWLDKVDVGQDDPRHPFVVLGQDNDWHIKRTVANDATTGVPTMKVGIAVQPVGAPLIAGYRISDELAQRAKERRVKADAVDEHAVAWALEFDTPERVVDRMRNRTAGNGDALTAQPMLGSEFRTFLHTYFPTDLDRSLRGENWRENRSWLIGDLAKLLEHGHDLTAELDRRHGLGLPHELPEPANDPQARARLFEALELIDLHLDVPLTEKP